MPKLHWEDFQPGAVAIYGPRLVTREEIVAFAAEFDPQPMHLDEAAASATMLGGLGASGWHTCCLLMRMIADGFVLDSSSMGAPGIDEVRWLKPLRPGTNIRIRVTVLECRPSNSRPEMGLVKFRYEVLDEAESCLTVMTSTSMFGRRQPETARMKFFEDIRVGDVFEVGHHTFTADNIKAFAARFDPQLVSCRRSGGRTLAFRRAVRLRLAHRRGLDAADDRLSPPHGRRSAARGEPVAGIGPALGFRELKWLKPVYVGDTIEYKSEVVELRPSKSRPKVGLMSFRTDRRQPERRAGDFFRQHHLCRAAGAP